MVIGLAMRSFFTVLCFVVFSILISCSNTKYIVNEQRYKEWYLNCNESYDSCGYVDEKGNEMISLGKYTICYTDTFNTYAIVFDEDKGIVGIDKEEVILFKVFPFDNGPDTPHEGLFRIIDSNGRIGYANIDGIIVIPPQYDCAFSFEEGKAKVSVTCEKSKEGEHTMWLSEEWFYINTTGEKVD